MPGWMSKHWLFRGLNNVTHHDNHHTNMRCNYGAFFNIWDRLMGTFIDNEPLDFESTTAETSQTADAVAGEEIQDPDYWNIQYPSGDHRVDETISRL